MHKNLIASSVIALFVAACSSGGSEPVTPESTAQPETTATATASASAADMPTPPATSSATAEAPKPPAPEPGADLKIVPMKVSFDAKSPMDFIQKHVVEPPIPLGERIAGMKFPKGLDDVLARAMSKSAKDRYQSAIEFAAALRPFTGAGALVDSIFQMTPAPPSATGAALPPPSQASGPTVKLLVIVAVVCLAVGVGLALAVMKLLGK